MPLNSKQLSLHWREFSKATRFCDSLDLPRPDRHTLYTAALGQDKSLRDFTNADLDKVLAGFRALSDPANVQAQLRQLAQPKTRLLYSINRLSAQFVRRQPGDPGSSEFVKISDNSCHAPSGYALAIALDRFGTTDLEQLSEAQLEQLRNTLADRLAITKRKRKARKTDLIAVDSNNPF
jgi:hypothetical protein